MISLLPYFICPVYEFQESQPFSGRNIYNPYSSIDSNDWLKINFHAHTYVWLGFTDGRKNEVSDLNKLYEELEYDVICFSDYQSINNYLEGSKCYIPVYEHGYGLFKNHQLVIGADEIVWTDYFYMQTLSHEQDIINRIKKDNNVICLNHPNLRSAYASDDMRLLTGYDYLEIINPYQNKATELWDDALSSGHKVFALANDDTHNADEDKVVGISFNLVNSSLNPDSILNSLRTGKTISVEFTNNGDYSISKVKEKSKNLPVLQKYFIAEDTIFMILNKPAKEIVFIGQEGLVEEKISDSKAAKYYFKDNDTYIRTEIISDEGPTMYLNPVFRYNSNLTEVYPVKVNELKTNLLRIFYLILLFLVIFLYYFFVKRKRNQVSA